MCLVVLVRAGTKCELARKPSFVIHAIEKLLEAAPHFQWNMKSLGGFIQSWRAVSESKDIPEVQEYTNRRYEGEIE